MVKRSSCTAQAPELSRATRRSRGSLSDTTLHLTTTGGPEGPPVAMERLLPGADYEQDPVVVVLLVVPSVYL
jgi:hypothetical protein